MLKPFDADRMQAQPVSDYVNSPLHEGKRCVEQIATT